MINKPFVNESIICISNLSKSFKSKVEKEILVLLIHMFQKGLSTILYESLFEIVKNIPNLLQQVQELLLDYI